eukprot:350770-Chlamydomonas_euryale.AAC.4
MRCSAPACRHTAAAPHGATPMTASPRASRPGAASRPHARRHRRCPPLAPSLCAAWPSAALPAACW